MFLESVFFLIKSYIGELDFHKEKKWDGTELEH